MRYRKHAEMLRANADSDMYEQTKRLLLHVAKDYELMAEMMDAIERSHRNSKAVMRAPSVATHCNFLAEHGLANVLCP